MGEEDRRQLLLNNLNTHYSGQGMAEAFNVKGDTDILVRHENANVFIGECKFWSGQKGFVETIDQLFGYRAWRDTKLAVIMFVRERGLTSIIERAREALAEHEQFVEWQQASGETELRRLLAGRAMSVATPSSTSLHPHARGIGPVAAGTAAGAPSGHTAGGRDDGSRRSRRRRRWCRGARGRAHDDGDDVADAVAAALVVVLMTMVMMMIVSSSSPPVSPPGWWS